MCFFLLDIRHIPVVMRVHACKCTRMSRSEVKVRYLPLSHSTFILWHRDSHRTWSSSIGWWQQVWPADELQGPFYLHRPSYRCEPPLLLSVTWVPGTRTQAILLVPQSLHPLSPSPSLSLFIHLLLPQWKNLSLERSGQQSGGTRLLEGLPVIDHLIGVSLLLVLGAQNGYGFVTPSPSFLKVCHVKLSWPAYFPWLLHSTPTYPSFFIKLMSVFYFD